MTDLPSSWSGTLMHLKDGGKNNTTRIPELDGLRGIGALAILLYHMWPSAFFIGWTRVDLFFVLSGYLITSILLKHELTLRFLFVFWVRRALRIWPAYYLLLVILFLREILCGNPPRFDAVVSYVTFTQNLPYYWSGPILSFSGYAVHTWALAIEEQFYLLWPLIVSFTGRRFLIPVVLWMLMNSLVFRMFGFYPLVALARWDGLAFGTILAVCLGRGVLSERCAFWVRRALICIGLAAVLFLGSSSNVVIDPLAAPSGHSPLAILFASAFYCSIVGLIILHTGHPLLTPLRFRLLGYLGRISYGLFLYHLLIIDIVTQDSKYSAGLTQWVAIFLSLLTGAISWECVERPLSNLKKRFPYEQVKSQSDSGSPCAEDRSIKACPTCVSVE